MFRGKVLIALLIPLATIALYALMRNSSSDPLENQKFCFNLEFLEEKEVILSFGEITGGIHVPMAITPKLETPSQKPYGAHFIGELLLPHSVSFQNVELQAKDGSGDLKVSLSGSLKFLDNDHFIASMTGRAVSEDSTTWKLSSYGQKGSCPGSEFVGSNYPKIAHNSVLPARKIARLSKFRSSARHSATDNVESCRSMKHYLETNFKKPEDARMQKVSSPINGQIVYIFDSQEDQYGQDVVIQSTEQSAFKIRLYHLTLSPEFKPGDLVTSGQELGFVYARDLNEGENPNNFKATMDVELWVRRPEGTRLISFFEILDDAAFIQFEHAGLTQPWKEKLYLEHNDPQVLRYRCNDEQNPARFTTQSPDRSNYFKLNQTTIY